MRYILLDGRRFATKEGSHRYLRKKLGQKEYLGSNLDALYDVLTSLPPCRIRLRRAKTLSRSMDGYGASIMRVFIDAARENPGLEFRW